MVCYISRERLIFMIKFCGQATPTYRMRETMVGRKVGEFGESSVICQTKTSKLVLIINNLLADLLICQTAVLLCCVLVILDLQYN